MTTVPPGLIRWAVPEEAALLHELTGRSALHWGYEPEFLDWASEDLRVTPEFISGSTVYVLEENDGVLGYYALCGQPPTMSLRNLFVEPDRIGTGCGGWLRRHAIETARAMGAETITITSDPNAAPFYKAMGAVWQCEATTSCPGWKLQMLEYAVGSRR